MFSFCWISMEFLMSTISFFRPYISAFPFCCLLPSFLIFASSLLASLSCFSLLSNCLSSASFSFFYPPFLLAFSMSCFSFLRDATFLFLWNCSSVSSFSLSLISLFLAETDSFRAFSCLIRANVDWCSLAETSNSFLSLACSSLNY